LRSPFSSSAVLTLSNDRRTFVNRAAVSGAVLGAPAIATAQTARINWKMTCAYGKGSPFSMHGPGNATDLVRSGPIWCAASARCRAAG